MFYSFAFLNLINMHWFKAVTFSNRARSVIGNDALYYFGGGRQCIRLTSNISTIGGMAHETKSCYKRKDEYVLAVRIPVIQFSPAKAAHVENVFLPAQAKIVVPLNSCAGTLAYHIILTAVGASTRTSDIFKHRGTSRFNNREMRGVAYTRLVSLTDRVMRSIYIYI
jgi:hypothetical protein